ncbi:sensor histidine kinase [Flavobacterium sp.]|uniref:tetratricopeptide repeat-containing sensor histidine kinase n=1 Tax=Flavobacterium sp. TaxID=239 RepID=UPI002B4B1E88|nr:sensor histidine kinase [Flavobacterium sp.]HLP63751.1 sensor histidine kinase [Flavobacterium sp.]
MAYYQSSIRMLFNKIISLASILFASVCFCQDFKTAEYYLNNYQYKEALREINSININSIPIASKAKYYFLLGEINQKLNKSDVSYKNYILAQKLYKSIDSIDQFQEINLKISTIIDSQENNTNNATVYINEYLNYAIKVKDSHKLAKAYKQLGNMNAGIDNNKCLDYYKRAIRYNTIPNDRKLYSDVYKNIGLIYNDALNNPKIGLEYLKIALEYDKAIDIGNGICYNYINQASAQFSLKNYKESIVLLKMADKAPIRENILKTKTIIYQNLAESSHKLNDFKNAFLYNNEYIKYKDSLDESSQNIAINDIQTKYQTQQKELQIVKLKNHQIMNYSIIGFLIIVVTTSILAYKNLSKKKKIIEQEKLLETQKLETTLKEQELHEIDVMLESQEKERQRIANELHDNLGSMLATLKLNFENLKRHDSNPTDTETKLFEKTDDLIEEAYQKVRNISHLKNLGVIGSEGLLISVKKMAEKMSVIEKLQINVIPHGLNERLENTLEVMLFRMIQELCTNIIKHSEATEVNIYLTQHNDSELNIIIEDNGKGFDPKTIVATSGIGLRSIEKKVEQMNGTFTIDSIISKGTTIIIDLPI